MATTSSAVLGLVIPTPGTGEPYSQTNENANNTKIDSAIGAKTAKVTTATISNTAVETQLFGLNIVANTAVQGTVWKLVAWGTNDHASGATLTIRAKLGGVTLSTKAITFPASVLTAQAWRVEVDVVCTGTGVSGTWRPTTFGLYTVNNATVADVQTPSAAITKDTTVVSVFEVTAQWTAASASSTARCDGGYAYRVTNA